MAKLIAFTGLDGETVWINPSHVTCVKQEEGKAAVYLACDDRRPLFLDGAVAAVAKTLNDNMGWWL